MPRHIFIVTLSILILIVILGITFFKINLNKKHIKEKQDYTVLSPNIFRGKEVKYCIIYCHAKKSSYMVQLPELISELVPVLNKFYNTLPPQGDYDGIGVSAPPTYSVDLYGEKGECIGELYMQNRSIINFSNMGDSSKRSLWHLVENGEELYELLEKYTSMCDK